MKTTQELAKEARLSGVNAYLFRQDRGQTMTLPEQQEWDAIERFAALVRSQALDEAAEVCEARTDIRGTGAWVALIAAADAIRELKSNESKTDQLTLKEERKP